MTRLLLLVFFYFGFLSQGLLSQSYQTQQASLPCLDKKISIIAHIFKDSTGKYGVSETDIRMALEGANVFFKPICLSFEICGFEYHGNYQYDRVGIKDYGKINEIVRAYHSDYRLNMYFVSIIPDFCGLASGSNADPVKSGVFIKKSCVSPRTFAHELGHLFSLLHTFEGQNELVNGSNCATAGDQICDTPADPYKLYDILPAYVENCKFIFQGKDANNEYYLPDLGNIMSYYECNTCGFTWGQLKRMAEAYLNGSVKLW
ncbi:MAG: hypothetical protein KGS48_06930 [Bacteroidetes bacterium]|nr:hypothetical protein [Bacteroidota bacterium]